MPDLTSNILPAFLLIFATLFILCGLLLFALGWKRLKLRAGQANWKRVPAEIISVAIEPRTLDETRMYLPKVTYRFPVNDRMISASRLRLIERSYSKESTARRKLEKYQPGTTVMASFPAGNPEEVVLESGGTLAGLFFLSFGLAMVAAPLFLADRGGVQVEPIILGIVVLFCLLWLGGIAVGRREKQARRSGLLPPKGSGTDGDVKNLLTSGEKLLAIRLYRELHGTDLKTAKEAVEGLSD